MEISSRASTGKVGSGKQPGRTSKGEIQEKAMQMFLERGYHGTSTADLCRALNISKPTLYWYFKKKEDILFAIHEERVETLLRPILEEVRQTESPLEKIKVFIRRYVRAVCTHPDLKLLVDENMFLEPEHSKWVVDHWREMYKLLRDAFHALTKEGVAKGINEGFAVLSLIAMGTWPYNWFDSQSPEGVEALAATIEEIFLSGVLKPR